MEALIVLAFFMTALGMPMRTYIPVFVKDIFHRGPETYGNLLALMGLGSIFGSLGIATAGNMRKKGLVALGALFCLGAGISGIRSFEVVAVKRHPSGAGGRFHDGSLCHGEFAGAVDHHQRNARPRDERLQFRFPRRHAHGKPVVRMARPPLHRASRAGRERATPGFARPLLPAGATAPGRPLREENFQGRQYLVRPERFELPTYCSGGNRSIHLSYGRLASVYMGGLRSINVGARAEGPSEKARSEPFRREATERRPQSHQPSPVRNLKTLNSGLARRLRRPGRHGLRRDLRLGLRGRVRRLRRARFWGGPRLR